ncbi:MAG: hypothetical protein FWE36_01185 [Erysipelotrichales bacterium]|nr:hypothetical protein [Erysipelotrichales bacterium]
MKKKYFSLLLVVFLAVGLFACNGDTEDPGTTTTTQPTPQDLINPLNLRHPGARADVTIMVGALDEFDPRIPTFTGTRASERVALLRQIEDSFNVNIVYETFPAAWSWGPPRVAGIRESISMQTPVADAYFISSEWLPQLAELMHPVNSYLDNRSAVQAHTPSRITRGQQSFDGNLFGVTSEHSFANNGIFLNTTAIDALRLPNPVDMFLAGTWTNSAFRAWTEEAERAVLDNSDSYSVVFTGWPHFWLEGLIGSHGGYVVTENNQMGLLSPAAMSAMELLSFMSNSFDSGITDEGSVNWRSGRALMSSGEFWFLGSDMRFRGLNFDIGFVPFPVADGMHSINDFRPVAGNTSFVAIGGGNNLSGVSQEIIYNVLFSIAHGLPDIMTPEQAFMFIVERHFTDQRYIDAYVAMNRSGQGFFDRWATLPLGFAGWANPDGFILAAQEIAGVRPSTGRDVSAIAQAMAALGNNALDELLGRG